MCTGNPSNHGNNGKQRNICNVGTRDKQKINGNVSKHDNNISKVTTVTLVTMVTTTTTVTLVTMVITTTVMLVTMATTTI